jgi:hypothetical protein
LLYALDCFIVALFDLLPDGMELRVLLFDLGRRKTRQANCGGAGGCGGDEVSSIHGELA